MRRSELYTSSAVEYKKGAARAMPETTSSTGLVPVANLREFFRDALKSTFAKQRLTVEDQTEHYVVNLLTLFARSEALYERTPNGTRLKPLVVMLSEALDAPSQQARHC